VLALTGILVFATTFLAAALAVLVAWFVLHRTQSQALPEPDASGVLKNESISSISPWAWLLRRSDLAAILRRNLAQAELNWSVGRVTLLMLLSWAVTLAILMREDWMPGWGAAAIATGVALLPYLYIRHRKTKRFRKFEEGFPDALDSLARAMRAGHPFPSAMQVVSGESDPPVSTELRQVAAEGNFGTSWEFALQGLAERMPLLEVNLFMAAVQMQNRTGGKLGEVLAKLAETMRESTSLKGEVRALAAHGKLTGAVLTILPLVIVGMMLVVNPAYIMTLFTTPYGKYMVAAAVACLILAHFVIRKIVDIRV
jgi:tight adherence protein B